MSVSPVFDRPAGAPAVGRSDLEALRPPPREPSLTLAVCLAAAATVAVVVLVEGALQLVVGTAA
jgi:hypothetical protein